MDRQFLEAMRFLESLPGRTGRMMEEAARGAAEAALQEIYRRLPDRSAYRVYRRSLRVVGVNGLPWTWGVQADPRAAGARKLDSTQTAIYVRPRPGQRAPAAVYVLRKWGPWTVETLPFVPDRNLCEVEYRRVSRGFVASVAARNREQKRMWQHTLGQVGRKPTSSKMSALPPRVGLVPDFALDAVRLEFGLNGVKAQPHWGPALGNLAGGGLRAISRQDRLRRLLDPRETWKGPSPSAPKISQGEAEMLDFFQKTVR